MKCPNCGHEVAGAVEFKKPDPGCPECHGKGFVTVAVWREAANFPCSRCFPPGTGMVASVKIA